MSSRGFKNFTQERGKYYPGNIGRIGKGFIESNFFYIIVGVVIVLIIVVVVIVVVFNKPNKFLNTSRFGDSIVTPPSNTKMLVPERNY